MGQISLSIPSVGQPVSTEDPKIANDFTILQTLVNGNIDTNNLAARAGITGTQMANGTVGATQLQDAGVTKTKLASDALNAFLKLATAADVKVAFGVSATGSFAGAKTVTGSIAFGVTFGATPKVLASAGSIATQTPSTSAVAISVDSPTTTGFSFRANIADGGISNNSTAIYWLAIG